MISAGLGRYGPFVLHDGTYANLESIEDVFSIGINRAVSVIAEKKSKTSAARGGAATALKDLGEHPDGGKITVRDGRYGPYVNWAKVNATLPKGKDPASVTIEEALELIAAKGGKAGGKTSAKGGARRAKPKSEGAAKPAAAKTKAKPAAKKAPKKAAGKA